MSDSKRGNSALPRRNFIQKAAAGLGAAALGNIGAKETEAAKPDRHWDLSADVVIIGSGAAGLPASIAATEAAKATRLFRDRRRRNDLMASDSYAKGH